MHENEPAVGQQIEKEPNQGVVPVAYTAVDSYTTFDAEFARVDGDIVVHFFLPVDALTVRTGRAPQDTGERDEWGQYFLKRDDQLRSYWLSLFPQLLRQSAEEVFHAKPPRLAADYVPEVSSWFFKAQGFHVLRPDDLVRALLTRMDQGLEEAGAAAMLARKDT